MNWNPLYISSEQKDGDPTRTWIALYYTYIKPYQLTPNANTKRRIGDDRMIIEMLLSEIEGTYHILVTP